MEADASIPLHLRPALAKLSESSGVHALQQLHHFWQELCRCDPPGRHAQRSPPREPPPPVPDLLHVLGYPLLTSLNALSNASIQHRPKVRAAVTGLRKGPWQWQPAHFVAAFGAEAFQSQTFAERLRTLAEEEPDVLIATKLVYTARVQRLRQPCVGKGIKLDPAFQPDDVLRALRRLRPEEPSLANVLIGRKRARATGITGQQRQSTPTPGLVDAHTTASPSVQDSSEDIEIGRATKRSRYSSRDVELWTSDDGIAPGFDSDDQDETAYFLPSPQLSGETELKNEHADGTQTGHGTGMGKEYADGAQTGLDTGANEEHVDDPGIGLDTGADDENAIVQHPNQPPASQCLETSSDQRLRSAQPRVDLQCSQACPESSAAIASRPAQTQRYCDSGCQPQDNNVPKAENLRASLPPPETLGAQEPPILCESTVLRKDVLPHIRHDSAPPGLSQSLPDRPAQRGQHTEIELSAATVDEQADQLWGGGKQALLALLSDGWLNDAVVRTVLERFNPDPAMIGILYCNGLEFPVGSPGRLPMQGRSMILAALCTRDHWVVAYADRRNGHFTVYDPLHSSRNIELVRKAFSAWLDGYIKHQQEQPKWKFRSCLASLRQDDAYNCGIYAIVFAICTINAVELPSRINPKLWRHVIAAGIGMELDPFTNVPPKPMPASVHICGSDSVLAMGSDVNARRSDSALGTAADIKELWLTQLQKLDRIGSSLSQDVEDCNRLSSAIAAPQAQHTSKVQRLVEVIDLQTRALHTYGDTGLSGQIADIIRRLGSEKSVSQTALTFLDAALATISQYRTALAQHQDEIQMRRATEKDAIRRACVEIVQWIDGGEA